MKSVPTSGRATGNERAEFGAFDMLTVALWAAVVFGFAEGVVLGVVRFFPRILAPFKASAHQLFIAPLVDMVLFATAVPLLCLVFRITRTRISLHRERMVFVFFVFLGAFTVIATPRVMHPAASTVLALGIAIALTGTTAGREIQVVKWLRRRLFVLPLVIVMAAAAVFAWNAGMERARVAELPQVQER